MWPSATIYIVTSTPERFKKYFSDVICISKVTQERWVKDNNLIAPILGLIPANWIPMWIVSIQRFISVKTPLLAKLIIKWQYKIRRYSFHELDLYVQALMNADLVMVTGGILFTDLWARYSLHVLNALEYSISNNIPTVICSQAFVTLENPSVAQKAKKTLPKVDLISIREKPNSIFNLRDFGVSEEKISIVGDDAIEIASAFRRIHRDAIIGVQIRASDKKGHTNINAEILQKIKVPIQETAKRIRAKLMPLPISSWKDDLSRISIRQLLSSFENIVNEEFELQSPEEFLKRVSRCKIVISGSYQLSMIALSQGIPTICLTNSDFYDHKFNGLAEHFRAGCCIISLKNDNFDKLIRDSIFESWHRSSELYHKLLCSAQVQINSNIVFYKKVFDMVNCKKNINK